MSSRNIRRLLEQKERDKKKKEEEFEEDTENEDNYGEFSPHFVQMNPAYEGVCRLFHLIKGFLVTNWVNKIHVILRPFTIKQIMKYV